MTVTINGTTGIAGTNGSAGTPAVQGEDTNTGVFFPTADTVAVATGGSERLRVDSSGNVGIGTITPNSGLHLKQTNAGGDVTARIQNSSTAADSKATLYFTTTTNDTFNSAFVGSDRNNALILGTNGSERARIDASGNLLVGTTSGPGRMNSAANGASQAMLNIYDTAAGSTAYIAINFIRNGSGVGYISTTNVATAYVTSSDYRLKENVQPMQDALAKVAQLNPVTYTWKVDGSAGQGFIAHELQAVVPDCVTGEKDAVDADGNPQYQGVDTSFLVATLVKAVQELTARVAELENK